MDIDDAIAISALQHYAYCPRQYALIHIEQAWAENRFTAEGRVLHERVDSGMAEQRRHIRYERGVLLRSERYCLVGKMDLLEIENEEDRVYRPVEYKRGKPKVEDWDRIQLCAQALCIEDMRNVTVTEGAIWYWEIRRRIPVVFDDALRQTTQATIQSAHEVRASGRTPVPTDNKKRCRACSLIELCQPDTFRKDKSVSYIKELFESDEETP